MAHLHHRHLVAVLLRSAFFDAQIVDQAESCRPHDEKVEDHGNKDAENRPDVVQNASRLFGENEKDATQEKRRSASKEVCDGAQPHTHVYSRPINANDPKYGKNLA